ncbi:MAG: hypothetical protein GXO04_05780 [Aquificae bacterium]|nr:hypothetical protein [Aquificota bacterium]
MDELRKLKEEANELRKLLRFMAWLNKRLKERGAKTLPILVGGSAVELYTFGFYVSGDIDLVAQNREEIKDILLSTGLFEEKGRILLSEELGVFVDIPDDKLAGSYEKVRTIKIPELGAEIKVIGIEDLIVDRLNACIFWKSQSDCEIARYLFEKYKDEIDIKYLIKRVKDEKLPLEDINFLKEDEKRKNPET